MILGHLNIRVISNQWITLQRLEYVNLSASLNSVLELNNRLSSLIIIHSVNVIF